MNGDIGKSLQKGEFKNIKYSANIQQLIENLDDENQCFI
jgi:hypothetical protein